MFFAIAKGLLIGLIVLGYPILIYYLLSHDLPWLGAILVIGIIIWKIRGRADWLWWLGGLIVFTVAAGYLFGPGFISKSVPVLIHVTLFLVFWQSLKTTPLITQFARLDFPELPPGIEKYCRSLTIVWSGFFAMNIVLCIGMAFASSDKLWAVYNGLIVYFLIAALVVGEYIWRRLQFPGLEVPSLSQSIKNIHNKGPEIWNNSDRHVDHSE